MVIRGVDPREVIGAGTEVDERAPPTTDGREGVGRGAVFEVFADGQGFGVFDIAEAAGLMLEREGFVGSRAVGRA